MNDAAQQMWTDDGLAADSVHVWAFSILESADEWLLSGDEISRMQRLIDPIRRRQFAAARTRLRQILSRYTGTSPEVLVFDYSQQGKPFLVNTALHFNLTHSGDHAMLAVALQPVGIDLERLPDSAHLASMAQIAFSPDEHAAFGQIPDSDKPLTFLRTWTRKEALIKAQGDGFRAAHTFSLALSRLPGSIRVGPWTLIDLLAPAGFAAALAVQHADPKITYMHA